ncbi:MAG: hypothetical protein PHR56_05680 [Dehalococcoidales bacterium]|nr:hypothetical protein [Dehalococcoidales bacterium]
MTTKVKRIIYSALGVLLLSGLIFGSSVYAKSTLNPTELSHFFVPFPAGKVVRPMTVNKPDGGSIFVRPITINVDQRGILKRIFNPAVEGLSTHWLDNIDSKPHRIGMKFTNVTFEVEWDVNAAIPWDDAKHEFEVAVGPGERIRDLGVDWLFFFPPEVRAKDVWYDGSLVVYDADTGETLTTIPIKFQKSTASTSSGRPK